MLMFAVFDTKMGASGADGAVTPAMVKYAGALARLPPPQDFASKVKYSPDAAPLIQTHFGQVSIFLNSVRMPNGGESTILSGFWLRENDGSLSSAPEEAVAELLDNEMFSSALAEGFNARKNRLFHLMVKSPLLAGDMVLYQTDPDRRRTFLFHIGDGREIVVFSNESRTELLRAALIRPGMLGAKNIERLPDDLYEPLFEHDSISAVLDAMVLAKPFDGISPSQISRQPATPQFARQPSAPQVPKIPSGVPKGVSYTPPKPTTHYGAENEEQPFPEIIRAAGENGPLQGDESEKITPIETDGDYEKPPLNLPNSKKQKGRQSQKQIMQEKKQASQAQKKFMKGKVKPLATGAEESRPTPEPSGEYRLPPSGADPFATQQRILSTLEKLHRERLEADSARERLATKLNGRLNSLEKALKSYSKELAEYESVFTKKKESVESALRSYEKFAQEFQSFRQRIDEMGSAIPEIEERVAGIEAPSQKEEEWAQTLADSLANLKEVSRILAESERLHKEKVEKMSEQLQRSFQKSLAASKRP